MKLFRKKAQELSINFLVKFILAIVMFGMGFVLLKLIFSQGVDLMNIPQSDIDDRIFALNCDSKQSICVGRNSLTMSPGQLYVVDVKLYNNYNQNINAKAIMQLIDSNGEATLDYPGKISIQPLEISDIVIPAKGNGEFSIAIVLGKKAPKGSYVVRIAVDRGRPDLPELVKRINLYIE